MITEMLIQQLYNDGLDEVAELIKSQQVRIANLEEFLILARIPDAQEWRRAKLQEKTK
tara:strand:- start:180 stop:353 length:174 start_codon:yes stop_codon:yes gene_type:complete